MPQIGPSESKILEIDTVLKTDKYNTQLKIMNFDKKFKKIESKVLGVTPRASPPETKF